MGLDCRLEIAGMRIKINWMLGLTENPCEIKRSEHKYGDLSHLSHKQNASVKFYSD